MDNKLTGILPAFMTAFTDDSTALDCIRMRAHVQNLKAAGVHGLYVGGSSGEMVLCSVSERMQLLETVMENSGDLAIVAHVGAMSTADSVALAKHAATAGAHAVSSVTPLYYKYSFAEVKQYYQRLCDAAGLPLIIYNIPAITGMTLDYDQLCQLMILDGIAGMKFTSSDFFLLNRLKETFPDKVIYNGSDEMLLSGLAAGADGGIGTTYNFMPQLFVQIYNSFNAGELEQARRLQSLANRVIACVIRNGVVPAAKYMISLAGLDYGVCREPFLPLTDAAKADLRENAWQLLREYYGK